MGGPAWRRIVDQLAAEGYESPYLDRLRARVEVGAARHGLEREILQEMVAALGRAEDRLNLALLELERLGREIDVLDAGRDAPDPAERAARVDAFNRHRDRARQRLWELVVHREALGFTRNDGFAELYPIPPRR